MSRNFIGFLGFISLLLLVLLTGNIGAAEAHIHSKNYSLEDEALTTLKAYGLNIDGQKLEVNLFINQLGQTMISAQEIARIFPGSISWVDQKVVEFIFTPENGQANPNNFTISLARPPIISSEDIYIPLRYLVQGLGYSITYYPEIEEFYLYEPDNQAVSAEEINKIESLLLPDNLPTWGELGDFISDSNLISSFYTTLLDNSPARTNNVALAANAVNNMVIDQGETFSFNKIVGQRTLNAGYQKAPIFVGKKVIDGLGGGICQVSSTLYNTALKANLPIIERHPHSLRVAYVPSDQDASVAWGLLDFKFKNTYEHPIRLAAKVIDKYLVTSISTVQE